jgi:hypothetical protein
VGGIGSGRQGGGPTVEDGLRLDLARLWALGHLRPGRRAAGTLSWTSGHDGRMAAQIGLTADLTDPEASWVRLRYDAIGRDGAVRPYEYQVALTTTRPRLGGVRWWFVCPVSGRRARVLHLPPGAATFASRPAWGLAYRSQRQTETDRAIARSLAARRRLGVTDPDTLELPDCPRPPGMGRRAYERQLAIIRDSRERLLRRIP